MKIFLFLIFNISGYVLDRENSNPIPDVKILIDSEKVFITDSIGRFFLEIPEIKKLTFIHSGYKVLSIKKWEGETLTVYLEPVVIHQEEIVIRAPREVPYQEIYSTNVLEKIPEIIEDPFRSLLISPSMTVFSDLLNQPAIRGSHEILVLLDGVPFPYFTHFFGSLGTVSWFQIHQIEVYPCFPDPSFQGGLAGTVLLSPKFHSDSPVNLEMNLYQTRGSVSFASGNFSGNAGWTKGFIGHLLRNMELYGIKLNPEFEDFYINTKGKTGNLMLNSIFFYSSEKFQYKIDTQDVELGEIKYSGYSERSGYMFSQKIKRKITENKVLNAHIYAEEDFAEGSIFNWELNEWNRRQLGFGLLYEDKSISAGMNQEYINWIVYGEPSVWEPEKFVQKLSGNLSSLFFNIRIPMAFDIFSSMGIRYFTGIFGSHLLPRVSLMRSLPFNHYLSVGYGETAYPQTLRLFADSLFPKAENLYLKFGSHNYSVEGYFRNFSFHSNYIPTQFKSLKITRYKGTGQGIEFNLKKKTPVGYFMFSSGIGRMHWIGLGEEVPSIYEVPFLMNAFYSSKTLWNFTLNLKLRYASGGYYPLVQGYFWEKDGGWTWKTEGWDMYPPYIRMDVRLEYRLGNFRFNFDIINLFNRKNIWGPFYYEKRDVLYEQFIYQLPRIFSLGIAWSG